MSELVDLRAAAAKNLRFFAEIAAIALMTAIVITLGVVQYRWAGQISQTEQQRLQSAVETSVRNFSQDFSYDFQQLCESFQLEMAGPANTLETRLLTQYGNWSRASATPNLVTGVHIWRVDPAHVRELASYDEPTHSFREGFWPDRLAPLQAFLMQEFSALPKRIPDREAYFRPWILFEDTPALLRPLYQNTSGTDVEPGGFLIVELSGDYLSQIFLPDMVRRNFGEHPEFQVAVRSAQPPYQSVYSSVPAPQDSFRSPDDRKNLIEIVDGELRRRGGPGLRPSVAGREWTLLAQHPAGSVESAVAALRRRNLAISFGLLAVLATGMALIFEVARRAQRMARQQMEFVAGVSHELCTPLAVINSAAENLMDGVVEGESEVKDYAGMIRDQGRRLEHLVDEVLQFAAGRVERTGYDLRPVEIGSLVAQCLLSSEPMLRDAGFVVERRCAASLPSVLADPSAVGMCIENLISNAVKYSGENRSLRVGTDVVASAGEPADVQVSVEDHGMGISPVDLPHVFEPFFRVESARERQIRGVGLGLYLVKRAMEGMGGHVSVSSELGRGSRFTLHFPVTQPAEIPAESAAERRTGQKMQQALD